MAIVEAVRQGKPVPVPVIDTHTHMGPCADSGLHQYFETAEGALRLMEDIGVDAICTSPMIMDKGYMELANAQCAELIAAFPGKVYGNLVICPHDGAAAVKKVVDQYGGKKGFVAMKFLTIIHGSPLRPEYEYALKFAEESCCPLTFHYWGSKYLNEIKQILEKYPRLKLILAHQGGGHREDTLNTIDLMHRCDRLYIDTCGSIYNSLSLWEMAQLAGEDRMVFGTDIHYMEPRYEIGRVAFSGMPEEVMKKIFAENYLRLLEDSQLDHIRL